jgi:hypothetical protein
MGVFDFLRQFSGKKKEELVKEIKLEELDAWADSMSKKDLENVNLSLASIRERICEEKEKMEENIRKLNDAKLKNPNIPERAKQMAEGNRKSYAQKAKTLLTLVNLPDEFDEIPEFFSSFNNALVYFGKSTLRSYHILQEFFGEETDAIAGNIRNLDGLVKKAKKTADGAGIDKVNELKNKINDMHKKIKRKEELKEKIKLIKEEQQEQMKSVDGKEASIRKIEEGGEYKKFTELVNKKETLKREIEEIENQLFHSFSVITAALKKYERLTLDYNLVANYLADPLKALLEDKQLKILVLLAKMRESIVAGKLELKDKKKDKILQGLDKLNRQYFEAFLSRYNEANKKLSELESEIEKAEVAKEVEALKEKLKQDRIKLEEEKRKADELAKEFESINIENLKENMEKEIRRTGEEVKIIL